jgi:hypothetical protein
VSVDHHAWTFALLLASSACGGRAVVDSVSQGGARDNGVTGGGGLGGSTNPGKADQGGVSEGSYAGLSGGAEPAIGGGMSAGAGPSIGAAGQGGVGGCANVPCPSCSSDMFPVDIAGQCCPLCVPTNVSCSQGREIYAHLIAVVSPLPVQFTNCTTDADCHLLYPLTACATECGTPIVFGVYSEPVDTDPTSSWEAGFGYYASRLCGACPSVPGPVCLPRPVFCVAGSCSEGGAGSH